MAIIIAKASKKCNGELVDFYFSGLLKWQTWVISYSLAAHDGVDVGLAKRKRDKPIDAKRNASRTYDKRQQIKELSVYRVVAFPETPPLPSLPLPFLRMSI